MRTDKTFSLKPVLLLTLSLLATQPIFSISIGCPYLSTNIVKMFWRINTNLNHLLCLNDKTYYEDASKSETELIKSIAKELGFTKLELKNLRVKQPKKDTSAYLRNKNNFSAFLNTVTLWHSNNEDHTEALKDPNAKKFIYAHELSHIKYKHTLKKLFLLLPACPLITHFGVKAFKSLFYRFILKNSLVGLKKIGIKFLNFLDSLPTKLFLQMWLFRAVGKKMEKNADLGAAQLGPDVIRGGIKLIKAWQKMRDASKEQAIEQFEGSILKHIVAYALSIKNFLHRTLFSTHPLRKTRIRYLQEALEKYKNSQNL